MIVWKSTAPAHSVKVTAVYVIHGACSAAEACRIQHCEVPTSPSPPEVFHSTFGIQIYAFEVCPFTNEIDEWNLSRQFLLQQHCSVINLSQTCQLFPFQIRRWPCTWWDKKENGAQLQLPLTAFHSANSWSDYSWEWGKVLYCCSSIAWEGPGLATGIHFRAINLGERKTDLCSLE